MLIKSQLFKLNMAIARENEEAIKSTFNTLCKIACKERSKFHQIIRGEYSIKTASAQKLVGIFKSNQSILSALNIPDSTPEEIENQIKLKMISECHLDNETQVNDEQTSDIPTHISQ